MEEYEESARMVFGGRGSRKKGVGPSAPPPPLLHPSEAPLPSPDFLTPLTHTHIMSQPLSGPAKKETASEVAFRALAEEGCEVVFANPGERPSTLLGPLTAAAATAPCTFTLISLLRAPSVCRIPVYSVCLPSGLSLLSCEPLSAPGSLLGPSPFSLYLYPQTPLLIPPPLSQYHHLRHHRDVAGRRARPLPLYPPRPLPA
jgi:hypothetical protein